MEKTINQVVETQRQPPDSTHHIENPCKYLKYVSSFKDITWNNDFFVLSDHKSDHDIAQKQAAQSAANISHQKTIPKWFDLFVHEQSRK